MILFSLLIWLIAVTIAITVHEFFHAYTSDRLGDPTARLQGRLSLNPLSHYDRIGTTMLIATSVMRSLGAPVIPFGWAKPVEYDPYNLRNPKRDAALIALAGPASNLLVAGIVSILLRTILLEVPLMNLIATAIITVNVSLAIFNLIPIHPLDGGKIIAGILPEDVAHEFDIIMHQYGFFLLIFLIMPFGGTSPLMALISPVISFVLNVFL